MLLRKLLEKRSLSDPGLAEEESDTPFAGAGALEQLLQVGELPLAFEKMVASAHVKLSAA